MQFSEGNAGTGDRTRKPLRAQDFKALAPVPQTAAQRGSQGQHTRTPRAHNRSKGQTGAAFSSEFSSPAIRVERRDLQCDGIAIRRLCASRPMGVDGGSLEVSLNDTAYLEMPSIPAHAIELSLFHAEARGDRSLSTTLLPEELDDLIATLVALREQGRALGFMRGAA